MPILLIDLALGVALVAAVAVAAQHAHVRMPGRRVAGWLLIAIPLPTAAGLQLFTPPAPLLGEGAFIVGAAAFACGAFLVLSGEDEDDWREGSEPGSPPWWPEFERDFRAYARRQSRPRVLR